MLTRAELARKLNLYRRQGRSIVFTNGCFDLLHRGHLACLAEARRQGDVLVVAINSDDSIRRLGKGPDRPVHTAAWRAAALASLPLVDYVTVFEEDTPLALLELLRPEVLVKGGDYGPQQVVGRELVESYGGRVHVAQHVPGVSTTALLLATAGRRAA